jgi:hypothetical protein
MKLGSINLDAMTIENQLNGMKKVGKYKQIPLVNMQTVKALIVIRQDVAAKRVMGL